MLDEMILEIKDKVVAKKNKIVNKKNKIVRKHQLKSLNEELEKGLKKGLEGDSIEEIQEKISKSLSEVFLSDKDIPISSKLFDTIKEIGIELDTIKDKDALDSRIKNVSFENPIEINGRTIINTGGTIYGNMAETQESINDINNAKANLTQLESDIPSLKKRFEENISILTKISHEQLHFKGTPRSLDDIDAELSKMKSLKLDIKKIMDILSSIKSTQESKNTPKSAGKNESTDTGEGESTDTSKEESTSTGKDLDPAIQKLWDNYFDINKTDIYTASTNSRIDIPDDRDIKYRVDLGSIDTTKDLYEKYSLLSNDIDKQIKNLGHERNLRDLTDSLADSPIGIPAGFLPFFGGDTVAKVGADHDETERYIGQCKDRLTQLKEFKKSIRSIKSRYKGNIKKLEDILKLQEFHERINNGDDIKEYQGKLDAMVDICENVLWLNSVYGTPEIGDQTLDLGGSLSPIPLNFVHDLSSDRTATYSLFSSEGRDADGKDIKLKKVEGVEFDQTNQSLLVKDLMIDPTDGIKFPVDLCLNIGVDIYDKKTGLTVKHEKPVILTINSPKLSSDDRKDAYDSITPSMDAKISSIYTDKYREDLENEIILDVLKEGLDKNGVKDLDKNDAEKNKLISNIRNRLKALIPFLKLDDLQEGFKEYITSRLNGTLMHIPYKDLINKDSFKKYIETNLDDLLEDYAHAEIYKKISEYRDDIILGTYGRNSLSNSIRKKSESNFNNYTTLLKGKSSEFETTNGNKLKIEVKGIDKIIATITINGTQEEIDVVNHDKVIEYILNKTTARDGTTLGKEEACRLAVCVLKAMTQISPKKLSKYGNVLNHAECNMSEIILYGPDNKLRYLGGDMDTNTQDVQYVTIFDESDMDGIDRSDANKVNEIEGQIQNISTQINTILNSFSQDYQKGLDEKLLRYNTAERLQKGSIKKLFSKDKDINNYDFDTKVSHLGKDINISFSEGNFIVTGEFEGQAYEYESKDLGDILGKEINRKRVFDGVELEIINQVNEEYVKQLRTNDSINNESFAIADLHENNTGRIYIFDSAGDLSYIEIGHERHNPLKKVSSGRIDPNDIAIPRHKCSDKERKEFFQNPLLAGRLIKEMKRTSRVLSFNKISASKIAWSKKKAVLKKLGWKRRLRLSTFKMKQKIKGSWIGKLGSKAINSLSNKFPKLFGKNKVSRTEKNKAEMTNKDEDIAVNSKQNTGGNP